VRKDGLSQLKLADNLAANAADREETVHASTMRSGRRRVKAEIAFSVIPGCAPLWAQAPNPYTPIVVMDSGLALRAPWK
jgi:hypothetical protein